MVGLVFFVVIYYGWGGHKCSAVVLERSLVRPICKNVLVTMLLNLSCHPRDRSSFIDTRANRAKKQKRERVG